MEFCLITWGKRTSREYGETRAKGGRVIVSGERVGILSLLSLGISGATSYNFANVDRGISNLVKDKFAECDNVSSEIQRSNDQENDEGRNEWKSPTKRGKKIEEKEDSWRFEGTKKP